MAVIHSAYYAMFHAARAVLFHATGAASRKHDRVVNAFGRRVRDGDASLRRCGRWLNAAKDGRMVADYAEDIDPAAEEAEEEAKLARDFLAACRLAFGFDPDLPPGGYPRRCGLVRPAAPDGPPPNPLRQAHCANPRSRQFSPA